MKKKEKGGCGEGDTLSTDKESRAIALIWDRLLA